MIDTTRGHSAKVEMNLHVGDAVYSISRVGAGEFTLRNPVHLEAVRGRLVVSIDGVESTYDIFIPNSGDGKNVRYF